MFNYDYFDDFVKKLIICNQVPLQIELQTGRGCAGYNCKFCYGRNQILTDDEELTNEDYYKLLDDINGKVKFITMAGIRSDPLNNKNVYDIIRRIKENGFRLGIHTKGHLLTEHISDLLNSNTAYGDFITFSIDASDKEVYNNLHGLPKESHFFDIVKKNIEYLYERKKLTDSELNINVSYLLFKDNSSKEQMERFIKIFGDICNKIRFSLPQIPNKSDGTPEYYLSSSSEVKKVVDNLKNKYPNKSISFIDFDDNEHNTDFKYCHAQRFLAVIDHCGYVYPCPQVTTMNFKHITYGNIKNKGFWDIWASDNRHRIINMEVKKMACRICDRKDECLNAKFSKMFGDEKIS